MTLDVELKSLANKSPNDLEPGDGWRMLQCLAGLCMIIAVFLPWFPASASGEPPASYFKIAWQVVWETMSPPATREITIGNRRFVSTPPRPHPVISIGTMLFFVLIGLTGVFVILRAAPSSETVSNTNHERPPRLNPMGKLARTLFALFWDRPAVMSLVVFAGCWWLGLAQTGAPGVWLYGVGAFFALMAGLIIGQIRPAPDANVKRIAQPSRAAPLPGSEQIQSFQPAYPVEARWPKADEARPKPVEPPIFNLRANIVAGVIFLFVIVLGIAGVAYCRNWMDQQEFMRSQNLRSREAIERIGEEDDKLLRQWQGFRQQREDASRNMVQHAP